MKKNQELVKDCMYGTDYIMETVHGMQGITTFNRLSGMARGLCNSLRKY